ncbi:MAG: helix-turn-helix domain-containing protein [Acidobacteriota bacterium]|nr:helix-turn-helix domain-containing protein [Acidobacteriota bacterium]
MYVLTVGLPFCHLTLKADRPKSAIYPDKLLTYGDHIRARRLNIGLSQREAAETIGVDETSVYNWESNRVEPSVRLIPNIIRFLAYCPYTPGLPLTGWLRLIRLTLGFS